MFKIPFISVDNYKGMLAKISFYTGTVTFVCVLILRAYLPVVKDLIGKLDIVLQAVGANAIVGIPSTIIGAAAIAFIISILATAFKLHDKISDALGIRKRFDVNCVLYPLAIASGANLSVIQLPRVRENRSALMGNTFYKYASSTTPVIDPHTITQALTNWSWFWVCLEAIAVCLITAIILTVNSAFQPAVWLFIFCSFLLLLMRAFYAESIKYAESQVTQILQSNTQRTDVSSEFNAL